jgi:hypothetical protein
VGGHRRGVGRPVTAGGADAISVCTAQSAAEPTRGAGGRDNAGERGGRPRLPRVPRHSSGSSASKPASSATCRRAGEAPLSPKATPASITAWRTRNNPAMPGEST